MNAIYKTRLRRRCDTLWCRVSIAVLLGMSCSLSAQTVTAPSADAQSVAATVQALTDSIARAQAQITDSQRQLDQMRQQLSALQQQLAAGTATAAEQPTPVVAADVPVPATLEDLQEQQDLQASQLATLEQSKVTSDSKYPVKISGMLLLNGFLNSTRVDMAATPTSALFGSGSGGATLRQTVLGVDARGPHLFGAESRADLRVDFDGDPAAPSNAYPGSYNANATVLRLRTAHAELQWKHTEAFFALDRSILNPDSPTSLTAVAEPALAWSGNLWAWNPQVGVTQTVPLGGSGSLGLQGALIDVSDAPATLAYKTTGAAGTLASTAEQSLRPGGEARLFIAHGKAEDGLRFGVGGYMAPHLSTGGQRFNAWAGTLDLRMPLPARLQLTGSAYRGQALGGLGAGQYKDYITGTTPDGETYFESLDDVGGWVQLKQQTSQRLQFNAAFGVDQVFAGELKQYVAGQTAGYLDFTRNHTFTGNVIYSPSSYLLFSLEYRRLETAPVTGHLWISNIYGIAAGYRF